MPRSLTSLRSATWAFYALAVARRQLRRRSVREVRLPAPPSGGDVAMLGVQAVLLRLHASCLEQALVLQRWHVAHGRPRDVVIGVAGSPANFKAHAWLDGETPDPAGSYRELTRVPSG